MDAIIMAAGLGNRLRPLTESIPKPMMPLLGRPVIERIGRLLVANGLTNIGVKLHYRWEQIVNHLGDGEWFGATLLYRVENPLLGTSQGVKRFSRNLPGTFCTIASDIATDADIRALMEAHKKAGALATIGLTRVQDVTRYGVVRTDDAGCIRQFQEKPAAHEAISDQVSTGIYILEPEVFQFVEDDPDYDFGRDLFPKLARIGAPLYGFPVGGYWNDIGTPSDYVAASLAAADGLLSFPGSDPALGADNQVADTVRLDECVLWPGVSVEGHGALHRCIVMQSCTLHGESLDSRVYVGGSEAKWVQLSV